MIKTTVIIPNYNGMEYLDFCIKSLQRSDVAVKILLVDNGSTDGSLDMVKEKYPEVSIIALGQNTGFSHAVNVGIRSSRTEYVFLLNDDAEVLPDTIGRLERDMDRLPKVFSIQAKMLQTYHPGYIDGAGDHYCVLGWAFAQGKDQPKEKYRGGLKTVFSASAGAAIYRRSLFPEIGYFDDKHFAYLEDVDLGYRANIFGYRNMVDLTALVYHAGSASSGSRHNEFKVRLSARNSVYMAYKNMPLLQLLINMPYLLLGHLVKLGFFIPKGMGPAYLEGLVLGLGVCASASGRDKRVKYEEKNLPNYIAIQVMLWINLIRRFIG